MTSSIVPAVQAEGGWSESRVLKLKALLAQGLSARQIASALGAVSRNAVIGKIHRLGLAGAVPPAPPGGRATIPARVRRASRRPALPWPPSPPRSPAGAPASAKARRRPVDPVEAVGQAADLVALGRGACHWPIGDPKAADFSFCGAPAPRAPYCEDHRARAYRAAPEDLARARRGPG